MTASAKSMQSPGYLLKVIPRVDAAPRVLELVRHRLEEVQIKGAWASPAALQRYQHVIADVAKLPVIAGVSALHFVAHLTLGMGETAHDYMADPEVAK
jgi:acetoacetate decarboxylase